MSDGEWWRIMLRDIAFPLTPTLSLGERESTFPVPVTD
jgi:hypothetical protein